jgi:hypothetical protein
MSGEIIKEISRRIKGNNEKGKSQNMFWQDKFYSEEEMKENCLNFFSLMPYSSQKEHFRPYKISLLDAYNLIMQYKPLEYERYCKIQGLVINFDELLEHLGYKYDPSANNGKPWVVEGLTDYNEIRDNLRNYKVGKLYVSSNGNFGWLTIINGRPCFREYNQKGQLISIINCCYPCTYKTIVFTNDSNTELLFLYPDSSIYIDTITWKLSFETAESTECGILIQHDFNRGKHYMGTTYCEDIPFKDMNTLEVLSYVRSLADKIRNDLSIQTVNKGDDLPTTPSEPNGPLLVRHKSNNNKNNNPSDELRLFE